MQGKVIEGEPSFVACFIVGLLQEFHKCCNMDFLRKGGLFKHKGNLRIWLTDDRYRIPVKVSSDLDFGNIVVLLESYELGNKDPL